MQRCVRAVSDDMLTHWTDPMELIRPSSSIYIKRYSGSKSVCAVSSFVTTHRQTVSMLVTVCVSSHYVSLLVCLCVVTLCYSVSMSVCRHTMLVLEKRK